jgi:hypothetical protein
MPDPVRTEPEAPTAGAPNKAPRDITLRAVLVGLVATVLLSVWIHHAELVLGGRRGHTALANTSIPVGAFNILFLLVAVNVLVRRLAPRFRFTQAELLTVYVMCAVSVVLSSSGGIHFLVPTITAVHYKYFATPQSGWVELFHGLVPRWLAQTDPATLKAFYEGGTALDLHKWVTQIAVWCGFFTIFATATLCLSLILRKQWIDSEHLPFPTVALPLEVAKEDGSLLKDRLFWLGTSATFIIAWWNTLALNAPSMPMLNLRGFEIPQVSTIPPWSAFGSLKLAFFPFAIGIGYLLSTEVVFSCWFFYLFSKMQQVLGAAMGWSTGPVTGAQSVFPYLSYQGAGAYLGLAAASIYVSRQHLRNVFRAAFGFGPAGDVDARGYRWPVFGLIACVVALIVFTVAAGASRPVSALFVILILMFLIAATRIRAETGNAWPMGPEIDAFRLMTTAGGTAAFSASDLTAMTYVRAATAGQDFRGVCMPQELDGLKIADSTGMNPGRLAKVMVLAVAFGVTVSFIVALFVWTKYGALAGGESWRSVRGKVSFDLLTTWLKNPLKPDIGGMFGVGIGAAFTALLAYLRMRYVWWPFHPVGYAMSNTFTSSNMWTPFFIAWLAKVILTRTGGMKLYRRALPLFFGFIAGDFLGGGTTTLAGCLSSISVYPVNW